jgi:hypothetical protein
MKSIYTASQLVAEGGSVFVHDCDRIVESTYARRFLGDNRLFTKIAGRSILQGYHFGNPKNLPLGVRGGQV